MNFNKALLMVLLLVMSILPAPTIYAGVSPIQFTNSLVDGAGLNTDFTITVTVKDADDYITKIALGEAPYKTENYNVYDCPENTNTCTAVFTIGEGNLHHITSEGTYYFRAFAKNSENQYAQYDVQVSIAAPSNFILRTAAVDGNDYSQGVYHYIPSAIQAVDQVVTTDAFATFSVQPNTAIGVSYLPNNTAYVGDDIAFIFDSRLQTMSGEGATYVLSTDYGQATTTCALNWATNNYDCELTFAGGTVPFEYQKTGSSLGNHVIRYYKPVFTAEDPIINFAGARFEVDEGSAVRIDLSSYIYNVGDVEISVPTVSWANIAVDQDSEVLVVAPYLGAVGSYRLPVTITANGVSDTDTVEIIVNDVADDAPVITASIPETTSITVNEDSGVYNFAVAAYDPENTLLSFEWQTNDVVQQTGSSNQYAWTIPPAIGADRTVVIEAVISDQSGVQTTRTWTATVIDAVPQASLAPIPTINEGESVTLDASASSMTFDADSIATYEFDVDGDGVYDVSQSTPTLVQNYAFDGTYDVTVRVTDDDGSQDTATQTVVVNNVPITNVTLNTNITSAVEPANATYTCVATGGNAPYTYNITQDAVQVADTNGTALVTGLSNATYVIGCTVTDADGDTLSAAPQNFTIADAAPTANFTFTPAGTVEGGTIEFISTSTTPLDAITSYTWSVDAAANATIQTPNASATNITFPLNGTFNVTLDIVDADGSTDSITQTVTISVNDTQNPVVGAITTVPVNVTVNDNVTLSAQVTDDVGVASVVFNITDPNATVTTLNAVLGANNTWSVTYVPTQVGIYTIDVTATDIVGKTGTNTTLMNVASAPVNNPPVLNPLANITVTVDTQANITFIATDADNDTLTYAKNITFANETFNASSGLWTFTPNASEVGVYTVLASVDDGNNGTDSQVFTINVTTTPVNNAPVVSIVSPANGTGFNASNAVLLNATATDVEDGDLSSSVSWYSDLDGFLGTNQTLNLTTLSIGTHTITANVTDSGNLTGTDAITITILAVGNAPTLSITSPLNASVYNETDSITFNATATDVEDGNLLANVTWTSNIDGVLGSGTLTTTLSSGNHTITATVTDTDNNTVTDQVQVEVLPVAPNNAPVVSIVSPANASSFNAGQAVLFNATATDVEDGDLSSSVSWYSDLDGFLGTNQTLTLSNLTRGTHTITANVTDSGNLVGSDSITITILNNAPVINPVADQSVTVGGVGLPFTYTFTATDADNDTLTYAINTTLGTLNASSGVWTYTPTQGEEGNYTVLVSVDDGQGGSDNTTFNLEVLPNQAPTPIVNASYSITENNPLLFIVGYTDAENNTVTFSTDAATVLLNASINASTGEFTYTPAYDEFHQDTTQVINITLDDGYNTVTVPVNITVIHVNQAPVFTALANQTIGENQTLRFNITATDIDALDTLTYALESITPTPNGSYALSGNTFEWNTTFADAGNYTAVFNVTDGNLSDTLTVYIEVLDNTTVPLVSLNANTTSGIAPLSVAFDGSVVQGEPPITFAYYINDSVNNLLVDTGNEDYNHTFTASGNYTVTFVATDVDGDQANATIAIQVIPQVHDVAVSNMALSNTTTLWLNDTLNVTATITNNGNVAENNITVELLDGTTVVDSTTISLSTAASLPVTFTYNNIPDTIGPLVVRASVAGETNLADNTQQQVIVVESAEDVVSTATRELFLNETTVTTGQTVTAYLPVQNDYLNKDFTGLNVQLTVNGTFTTVSPSQVQEISLAGGEFKLVTWTFSLPQGTYNVGATLGNNEVTVTGKTLTVLP